VVNEGPKQRAMESARKARYLGHVNKVGEDPQKISQA
jgi:hypothetical protein